MNEELNKIELLTNQWSGIKNQLETLFHNRDGKKTLPLMEQGIELFIRFLLLSNRKDELSKLTECAENSLNYKPVNVEERLAFIQSRPTLYQSFRQLCELMTEQEKIYAKITLKKKLPVTDKD